MKAMQFGNISLSPLHKTRSRDSRVRHRNVAMTQTTFHVLY